MTKKKLRMIGICMLVVAVLFIGFAITHPTFSLAIPIWLTYAIYLIYLIVMLLFLMA